MREICCDESGYEGEKLIDSATPFFAHASLLLGAGECAELLAELRARVRSPASEYKSGHLIRQKNRRVLRWFLSQMSPVYAQGSVFVIDKAHWVAVRTEELLGVAVDRTPYVLAAANDLLRGKDQPGVVDEFFRATGLTTGRERAELFRAWLLADPVVNSVLDPLVPALVAATRRWGPVTVLHDRQTMLPARRIAHIQELTGGALAGLRFSDGEPHPQIQITDILAGTVRWIAEHDDPELSELAAPYLDPSSIVGSRSSRIPGWSARRR